MVRLITALIVVSHGISSALIVALLSASGSFINSVPIAELGWTCMASSGVSESRLRGNQPKVIPKDIPDK